MFTKNSHKIINMDYCVMFFTCTLVIFCCNLECCVPMELQFDCSYLPEQQVEKIVKYISMKKDDYLTYYDILNKGGNTNAEKQLSDFNSMLDNDIDNNPNDIALLLLKSYCLFISDDYKLSYELIQTTCDKHNPQAPECWYFYSFVTAQYKKDFSRAIEYAKKGLHLASEHKVNYIKPVFNHLLGSLYQLNCEYNNAIEYFSFNINNKYNLGQSYAARGVCYYVQNMYSEAVSDFELAEANTYFQNDPKRVYLIDCYLKMGNISEAKRQGNLFLNTFDYKEIGAREIDCVIALKVLYLLNFSKSQLVDLSGKMLLRFPKSAKLYTMRSCLYTDMKEYEKAYADALQVLSIDPENLSVKALIFDYFRITNQRMKAIDTAEEYIAKRPNDIDFMTTVAVSFFDYGMTIRAEQLFEQILKHPDINKPENADEKEAAETGLRQLKGRSHEINFNFQKGILN